MHIFIYRFTKNIGNSQVLHSGQNVPVSNFGIRSKNVATGIHKSSVCISRIPENGKFEISSLRRRLVSAECNQKQVSSRQGFSTQSSNSARFRCKPGEIPIPAFSTNCLYRRIFQLDKELVLLTADIIEKIE